MKTLLIGGSGALGERYLERSAISSTELHVAVRSSRSLAVLSRFPNERVPCGSASAHANWHRLISNYSNVIYMANEPDERAALAEFSAIAAGVANSSAKMVMFSSAVVFTGTVVTNERGVVVRGRHWNSYARGKIAMEGVVAKTLPSEKCCIIRPGLIWGAGMSWLSRFAATVSSKHLRLGGSMNQIANIVHYARLIRLVDELVCAQNFNKAVINARDAECMSWFDFVSRLATICEGRVTFDPTVRIGLRSYMRDTATAGHLATWLKFRLSRIAKQKIKRVVPMLTRSRHTCKALHWTQLPADRETQDVLSSEFLPKDDELLLDSPADDLWRDAESWLRYAGYSMADKCGLRAATTI